MSQSGNEPSHRPAPGAIIAPLAYGISVQFHPPIKLERKKGHEFALKLASGIDARGVELTDERWSFSEPLGANPASRFSVSVTESQLAIEAAIPTHPQEHFEDRYGVILREFSKLFRPELVLMFSALVRATMPIDGDARSFLAQHVTKFEPARLKALGRPIHLLGIRLFLPPFQRSKEVTAKSKRKKATKKIVETTDWGVDVKAESLLEDPTKLFLEAQGIWQEPHQWKNDTVEQLVQGVSKVSEYLEHNFIPFLMHDSTHGEREK